VSKLKVVIVDDYGVMVDTVVSLLEPTCTVVGTFSNGQAAIDAMTRLQPDIMVLDIEMPGMSGLDVALTLRRLGIEVKLIFLTIHEKAALVLKTREAGGLGYVVKRRMATDLMPAVQQAAKGRTFVSALHAGN
jgi:DNA-binding NarL/FixJ family response regulator